MSRSRFVAQSSLLMAQSSSRAKPCHLVPFCGFAAEIARSPWGDRDAKVGHSDHQPGQNNDKRARFETQRPEARGQIEGIRRKRTQRTQRDAHDRRNNKCRIVAFRSAKGRHLRGTKGHTRFASNLRAPCVLLPPRTIASASPRLQRRPAIGGTPQELPPAKKMLVTRTKADKFSQSAVSRPKSPGPLGGGGAKTEPHVSRTGPKQSRTSAFRQTAHGTNPSWDNHQGHKGDER